MIAAGVGMPLHYLAEPESSTRTTAESAGTPTFKRFKRRQQYLVNVVRTLLHIVITIRRKSRLDLPAHPDIDITAPDITERDNANLAISVQRIWTAFAPIYNAKLIPPKEFIRLVYRFVAETPPENIGDFAPVNVRGGSTKLPPTDPSEQPADPSKDESGVNLPSRRDIICLYHQWPKNVIVFRGCLLYTDFRYHAKLHVCKYFY
jgi:hypothetical protein